MPELSFIPKHPLQSFTQEEKERDYSQQDAHYIRCLQAMEQLMDLDAYIFDYRNEKIVYLTKNCSFRKLLRNQQPDNSSLSFDFLTHIIPEEDLKKVVDINRLSFDFYFQCPMQRRYHAAYTLDVRMKNSDGGYTLVNYKISVLHMSEDGRLRLGLCLLSYPTSKITGKSYFKMTNTNQVYEYIEKSKKFIEVKSQRLTSKSEKVLELASQGKTEPEIAERLGISLHTVKYHKQRIFEQLNVRNIAEAIQWMNNQKRIVRG